MDPMDSGREAANSTRLHSHGRRSSLKVRIVTSLYASVIIPGINPGSKYAFKRESGDSLAVSAIAILKK